MSNLIARVYRFVKHFNEMYTRSNSCVYFVYEQDTLALESKENNFIIYKLFIQNFNWRKM